MGEHFSFDFSQAIERRGTGSRKWDATAEVFGNRAA